ncbi:MAG: hypothetical protein Q4G08_11605, partial [Capnocytophaga sp.]|nr:hypothetical protein [Capnocytophaga sp.]
LTPRKLSEKSDFSGFLKYKTFVFNNLKMQLHSKTTFSDSFSHSDNIELFLPSPLEIEDSSKPKFEIIRMR